MVFFACDLCGDSLKKAQVANHFFRCKSHQFSCIDCQHVFDRQTYNSHLKCITEQEKYGGANYVAKVNKGEVKQNEWMEQVTRAIRAIQDPKVKDILNRVKNVDNVPRKEAKFVKFLENSANVRDGALRVKVWKALFEEAEKMKREKQVQVVAAASGASKEVEEKPKQKEENNQDGGDQTTAANGESKEKAAEGTNGSDESNASRASFKWKKILKRKVRDAGNEGIKFKRLRQEVSSDWTASFADQDFPTDVFEQKIESAGLVRDGNWVRLKEAAAVDVADG